MQEDIRLSVVQDPADPTVPIGGRARTANRPRARYALPTDRLKFQAQVDALRAFAALSKNRQEPVSSEQLAAYLKVAVSTAGLNNVFFVESGLLEKSAKGRYLPTDAVMEFQRKHSFDPQQAGAVLKPVLTQTWYADVVRQRLLFGPADVDDLVKVLADDAGADASFKSQLESLIDWLALADVIAVAADRQVRIVGDEARTTVSTETTPAVPPVGRLLASDDADVAGASPIPRTSRRSGEQPPANHSSEPPVLSLAFDLRLSASDLARLTAEQIRQIFEGVGQIAAIRATLGDS